MNYRDTLRRLESCNLPKIAENAIKESLEDCEEFFEDEDDECITYCSACAGSGEGSHDGSTCFKCRGSGHENKIIKERDYD